MSSVLTVPARVPGFYASRVELLLFQCEFEWGTLCKETCLKNCPNISRLAPKPRRSRSEQKPFLQDQTLGKWPSPGYNTCLLKQKENSGSLRLPFVTSSFSCHSSISSSSTTLTLNNDKHQHGAMTLDFVIRPSQSFYTVVGDPHNWARCLVEKRKSP